MRRMTMLIMLLAMVMLPLWGHAEDVMIRVNGPEEILLVGETAIFTVTVENTTDTPMTGVRLSEIGICGGTWTGAAEAIEVGASMTASYAVRIPDAVCDEALFRLAWNGGEQTAETSLKVAQPAGLTLTVEADEWPWLTGKAHTMNVTVTNNDVRPLDNVTVTLPGEDGTKFIRKDRRKLKSAQQTGEFFLESLEPGDSVTLTAEWTPAEDLSQRSDAVLPVQAAVTADGRKQTFATALAMHREIVVPSMWTMIIAGGVSVGHVLCPLAALTLLTAVWASRRAKKYQ